MNKQIEQAYKDRPRSTVYQIVVSVIVVALIVWSGSAVEFTGGGANGGQIALNILKGIFHPDPKLLFRHTGGRGTGDPVFVSVRIESDAGAHRLAEPDGHHGNPYRAGVCLWTDVYPCQRAWGIYGTFDHVRVFHRYGVQDVY